MFVQTSRSSPELAILIFFFFFLGGGGGGGGGVWGGAEFLNNKTKYHYFRFSVNRRVLFFLREGKERGEEFISKPGS